MVNIVPFEPWHLQQLKLQKHELEMLDDRKFLANASSPGNQCISCFYEGKLLGIGGYLTLWENVLEVYVIPSQYIFEYPQVAFRAVQKSVKTLKERSDVHRIQSGVWDISYRVRFMEMLGFHSEGIMRKYTKDGQDYRIMAWTKGE